LGHDVVEACDGMQALEMAADCQGGVQLLCADMAAERLGGVALADRLRARFPNMKVLLLVTENPRFAVVEVDHAADYSVMRKPFSLPELTSKVREILTPAVTS
jgi:two-component system cell cycle sensor histidine kinase/response regulator CckA